MPYSTAAATLDGTKVMFSRWLVLATGTCSGSLFLMIVSMSRERFGLWQPVLFLVSILLLFVSFAASLVLPCVGAWVRLITRMETWWWMSVAYPIGFQLSVFALALREFDHFLSGFALVFFIAALSSALWALATLIQAARIRRLPAGRKTIAMLALAAIAAVPWSLLLMRK